MKIVICGYGNIGKYIYSELESLNPIIYDPNIIEYKDNYKDIYDVAFICVPTELKDGHCDISQIEEVLQKVNSDIYVIKSTIPPRTSKYLSEKYNKNIIFSPEFYGTTVNSDRRIDYLILGGKQEYRDIVANLYSKVKSGNFKIHFTTLETAELVKYMENCFLAMKVTFCNEFALIANKIGVSYPELRELFILDERVGSSHTWVYPEQPYYDSHCLNKDVPIFLNFIDNLHISTDLIKNIKKSRDNYFKDFHQ